MLTTRAKKLLGWGEAGEVGLARRDLDLGTPAEGRGDYLTYLPSHVPSQ